MREVIDLLEMGRDEEAVELLRARGGTISLDVWETALLTANSHTVEFCIERGAPVAEEAPRWDAYRTALVALRGQSDDVLLLVLQKGAKFGDDLIRAALKRRDVLEKSLLYMLERSNKYIALYYDIPVVSLVLSSVKCDAEALYLAPLFKSEKRLHFMGAQFEETVGSLVERQGRLLFLKEL